MDETLARAAVDLSGRAFLFFSMEFSGNFVSAPSGGCAGFQPDVTEDFWQAFAGCAGAALHLDILRGRSDHHKIEAVFKAAARALRDACEIDKRAENYIPSTKGVLA